MKENVGRSGQGPLEGERLHLVERVVVSGTHGRFRSLKNEVVGTVVTEGQTIGLIDQRKEARPVVSLFRGEVIDMLVCPGELVREGQPIAWLRVV